MDHLYCLRSSASAERPLPTKSCGTPSWFRYGRTASACSVPTLLKIANTFSSSTSSRVLRTVSDGS